MHGFSVTENVADLLIIFTNKHDRHVIGVCIWNRIKANKIYLSVVADMYDETLHASVIQDGVEGVKAKTSVNRIGQSVRNRMSVYALVLSKRRVPSHDAPSHMKY